MKRVSFFLILFLVVYVACEAILYVGLAALSRFQGVRYAPLRLSLSPQARDKLEQLLAGQWQYYAHDPLLGWTVKPNGMSELGRSNSDGIRSEREYQRIPPEGSIRIAAFGDSFTHGNEVRTNETWEEELMRGNTKLEVLNFGVAGYGLDQAFLRYRRDGVAFAPHIVLIGFLSENISRSVSVFRPFYTDHGPDMSKPRFRLDADRLVRIDNPMPKLKDYRRLLDDEVAELRRLGRNDYFFHRRYHAASFDFLPSVRMAKIVWDKVGRRFSQAGEIFVDGRYNPKSEAFRITARLFDKFYEACGRNGSIPIILIFPGRADLGRSVPVYEPLMTYFNEKGYRYIDLASALESYPGEDTSSLFVTGHYSALGNRIVAHRISEYLSDNRPELLAGPPPPNSR